MIFFFPISATPEEIVEFISQYGEIYNIIFLKNENNQIKKYFYVQYKYSQATKSALESLSGADVNGNTIFVIEVLIPYDLITKIQNSDDPNEIIHFVEDFNQQEREDATTYLPSAERFNIFSPMKPIDYFTSYKRVYIEHPRYSIY